MYSANISNAINHLFLKNKKVELMNLYTKYLKAGSRVLDIGCGDGIITSFLGETLHLDISGCDVCNFLLKKIPFVKMTKDTVIPYPDNAFDYVIFTDVVHHVPRLLQEKLLRESIRVCRKKILLYEVKPTLIAYLADFILNKISHPTVRVTLTFRNKEDWSMLLNKCAVKVYCKNIIRSRFSFFSHYLFLIEKRKQ